MYNTNGQSAPNTSETQHIPLAHLDPTTFLEPADMDATIEVETPSIPIKGTLQECPSAVRPQNEQESAPTYAPTDHPPISPLPTGDLPQPQQEARAPYYTQPLPCSYPLLWQSHDEECAMMRGVLLSLFALATLALSALLFSLMVVVATGIALCVVFLLMLAFRK